MSANEKPMINRDVTRVSSDYVRRAAEFQAAIIADVAGRRGTLHGRIKPLGTHMKVAGPAVTVEVRRVITWRSMLRWRWPNPAMSSSWMARAISAARC